MAVSPRPHLRGLRPAEHGGFHDPGRRVLDFSVNTNPFGPPPAVLEAFQKADVTRYPDPDALALREAIATRHRGRTDCVLPGNGSVEIIWLIACAYLEPGRTAMVAGPTFGEYAAAARAAGAGVTNTLDGATVAFLCNPNNPTGTLRPAAEIREIARASPDTLFVVDEAYLPFLREAPSCLDAGLMDNLIVLRSLTKDCAIPGLRLGYGVGPHDVIQTLKAVQPPWSVNAPAQAAGVAALGCEGHLGACDQALADAKQYLISSLTALGFEVLPSETNFFLVRVGDGAQFRAKLLEADICVRDCASFGLPDCIRIGVRTMPECQGLVAAAGKVLKHAR